MVVRKDGMGKDGGWDGWVGKDGVGTDGVGKYVGGEG